ncbi:8436_t:CDS:10 [Entrophospora sp. SA101]|nr:8436_t:CDS:10 [Entrophospora sp. SA101]
MSSSVNSFLTTILEDIAEEGNINYEQCRNYDLWLNSNESIKYEVKNSSGHVPDLEATIKIESDEYEFLYCEPGLDEEISFLKKQIPSRVHDITKITKLISRNFVQSTTKRNEIELLKISFLNVSQLNIVYNSLVKKRNIQILEHDIPYIQRVAIDKGFRAGQWYEVTLNNSNDNHSIITDLRLRTNIASICDIKTLAFDIEVATPPKLFPNHHRDEIMMLSYMFNNDGFLITNRSIVSKDIDPLSYSPMNHEYNFTIFNEKNEELLIKRFFGHIKKEKPSILVTYYGDFFDMPYIEGRFSANQNSEYKSSYCIHMDCFCWVTKYSELPLGCQGLKRVTESKLGYIPDELDPDEITILANKDPSKLARYSASDVVATYILFEKCIKSFIFSLSSIVPLNPDEILRQEKELLCETLLMVNAYNSNILIPKSYTPCKSPEDSKKRSDKNVKFFDTGVFRSDLPVNFNLDPKTFEKIIESIDDILKFAIFNKVYGEVCVQTNIVQALKKCTTSKRLPTIYRINASHINQHIILMHETRAFYLSTISELKENYHHHKNQLNYWKIELVKANQQQDFIKVFYVIRTIYHNNSLQLAYKTILDLFGHFVMHKESPTDNDGIWCMLPESFPGNFTLQLSDGNELSFSFPCLLINYVTWTNLKVVNQQRDFNNYFEIDDGFRAVIMPKFDCNNRLKNITIAFTKAGSLEENKKNDLVKFNEKNLMRFFEASILPEFLKGNSLEECYWHVNRLSENFLKIIILKGKSLSDNELIKYFSVKYNASPTINDSSSRAVINRMSEFLGDEILKESKITCHFVISSKPRNALLSQRAIPVDIFFAEEEVKKAHLRKWLGDPEMESFDVREIIHWGYYMEKLKLLIEKLVIAPACHQMNRTDDKENVFSFENQKKRVKSFSTLPQVKRTKK